MKTKITAFLMMFAVILSCCLSEVPGIQIVDLDSTTVLLNTHTIFSKEDEKDWDALGQFIVNSNFKTYVLEWGGVGGYVYIGHDFIHYLQTAQAQGKKIVLNLVNPSYSMHAVVACYADKLLNSDNVLMFHEEGFFEGKMYYRIAPKDSDIQADLEQCTKAGILTQNDIKTLESGNEIWKVEGHTVAVPDARPLAPGE